MLVVPWDLSQDDTEVAHNTVAVRLELPDILRTCLVTPQGTDVDKTEDDPDILAI